MSGSVTYWDGEKHVPVSWGEADAIAGCRVDRRLRCTISRDDDTGADVVEVMCKYTDECSGCTESVEGQRAYGPNGCSECGYTGKRVIPIGIPYRMYLDMRKTEREERRFDGGAT